MLEVGQKLWAVTKHRGDFFITIEKIGRKWAYAKEFRKDTKIDIETLAIVTDGYGNSGQCYVSKEKYEAEQELLRRWSDFRSVVRDNYRCPDNITIEKIEQILSILEL